MDGSAHTADVASRNSSRITRLKLGELTMADGREEREEQRKRRELEERENRKDRLDDNYANRDHRDESQPERGGS